MTGWPTGGWPLLLAVLGFSVLIAALIGVLIALILKFFHRKDPRP
jgi:hypothetical protein